MDLASGKNLLIVGGKVVADDNVLDQGYVLIQGEKILEVGFQTDLPEGLLTADSLEESNLQIIRVPDACFVMPGFIDLHIHGVQGADVMDGTSEALDTITGALPSEGVTSFLATTMTADEVSLVKALRTAAVYMEKAYKGAEVLGLHLEGPFINYSKAGAQDHDNIREPELELFNSWVQVARGKLRLVTLAPEVKGGIPFIKALKEAGVIPSVGHSEASFDIAQQAIEAGVSHATHLFNGMPTLHHREPGVVGAVLMNEKVKAEIIFDNIHVAEEMVQLAYRLKGSKGLILISDSIRAKELGEGEYELGGQKVIVEAGIPRLADGTLAGSVLRMNEAVQRAHKLVSGNLFDLVRLSALNAAEVLGLEHRKGTLTVGKDADLVVLDRAFKVQLTVCRGQIAYMRDSTSSIF